MSLFNEGRMDARPQSVRATADILVFAFLKGLSCYFPTLVELLCEI